MCASLTNARVAIHNISTATITLVAAWSVGTCLLARATPAFINIYNSYKLISYKMSNSENIVYFVTIVRLFDRLSKNSKPSGADQAKIVEQ